MSSEIDYMRDAMKAGWNRDVTTATSVDDAYFAGWRAACRAMAAKRNGPPVIIETCSMPHVPTFPSSPQDGAACVVELDEEWRSPRFFASSREQIYFVVYQRWVTAFRVGHEPRMSNLRPADFDTPIGGYVQCSTEPEARREAGFPEEASS